MRSIDQLVDDLLVRWKLPCERLLPEERDTWATTAGEVVLRAPGARSLF
jgi:hypothetical protein